MLGKVLHLGGRAGGGSFLMKNNRGLKFTKNYNNRPIVHRQLQVGKHNLNYVEMDGNAEHVVAMFPGSLSSIEPDFTSLLQKLNPEKFKAVAFDPPGYGKSKPHIRNFEPLIMKDDAEALLELMAKLGHTHYSVLGWSAGGISAFIMAVLQPQSIRKIVAWGASGYSDEHTVKYTKQMLSMGLEAIPAKRLNSLLEIYDRADLTAIYKNWLGWSSTGVDEAGFVENGSFTTLVLNKIKAPTLIIHGSKDALISKEQAEYLHKHIRGSKLYYSKTGSHATHLGSGEAEFITVTEKFLCEE